MLLTLTSIIVVLSSSWTTDYGVLGDDPPPAPAPPAGGGSGKRVHPLIQKGWDNERTKANFTALIFPVFVTEDPRIQPDIMKVEKSFCGRMYRDCLDKLKNKNFHLKPKRREDKCFMQTTGHYLCSDYKMEENNGTTPAPS